MSSLVALNIEYVVVMICDDSQQLQFMLLKSLNKKASACASISSLCLLIIPGKPAEQSSYYDVTRFLVEHGNDGDPSTFFHCGRNTPGPWWRVYLGSSYCIEAVNLINRRSYYNCEYVCCCFWDEVLSLVLMIAPKLW